VPTAETVAAFTFGSTAHAAFEAFTKERRERAARGEPPPTRADLGQLFAAEWKPTGFPDATSEQTYRRRTATLLDNFWDGELASVGTALHEELGFELRLDPGDGSPVVRIGGGDGCNLALTARGVTRAGRLRTRGRQTIPRFTRTGRDGSLPRPRACFQARATRSSRTTMACSRSWTTRSWRHAKARCPAGGCFSGPACLSRTGLASLRLAAPDQSKAGSPCW